MTKKLKEVLQSYFPFIQEYPAPTYTETKEFRSLLKPHLSHFKGISEIDLLIILKTLKSHLISLNKAQKERLRQEGAYREAIKGNKAYHKGIKDLEKGLELLYSDSVSQVIFKRKKDKITLEGRALEILQKVFLSFYSEDLSPKQIKELRNILPEYAEAYEEFYIQLKVLNSNSPLAKTRKKKLEADSIDYGFNQEINRIGFHLNNFILAYSDNPRNAERPALTKKILGKLLDLSGIEKYDPEDLKLYDTYISRKPTEY